MKGGCVNMNSQTSCCWVAVMRSITLTESRHGFNETPSKTTVKLTSSSWCVGDPPPAASERSERRSETDLGSHHPTPSPHCDTDKCHSTFVSETRTILCSCCFIPNFKSDMATVGTLSQIYLKLAV